MKDYIIKTNRIVSEEIIVTAKTATKARELIVQDENYYRRKIFVRQVAWLRSLRQMRLFLTRKSCCPNNYNNISP